MLIIVEGGDRSGKSTLAEALGKKFPGITLKITDRPKDGSSSEREKIKSHYERVLNFVLRHRDIDFILDRYYPSEMNYSFLRGYEASEDPFFGSFEDKLEAQIRPFLILCDPGNETMKERMKLLKDDYVSIAKNTKVYGRYREFFKESRINRKLKLNTSRPISELLTKIESYIYGEHTRLRGVTEGPKQLSLF